MEGVTKTAQDYYEWTDGLTPEKNDGKAFFGRDAMANYMIIGAMQQGVEIFSVENGTVTLNFDKDVMKKLWENYYVPFVKGYFAASGSFRSDDVKTGNNSKTGTGKSRREYGHCENSHWRNSG